MKRTVWFWVLAALALANLGGVWFAMSSPLHATTHAALAVLFTAGAMRMLPRQKAAAGGDVESLREQLEETRRALAGQATQLAELQERFDFAERVIAEVRRQRALPRENERG